MVGSLLAAPLSFLQSTNYYIITYRFPPAVVIQMHFMETSSPVRRDVCVVCQRLTSRAACDHGAMLCLLRNATGSTTCCTYLLCFGCRFFIDLPCVRTQPFAPTPPPPLGVFSRLKTVDIKEQVVVRSHTTLQTTGVHFLVHPTGSLTVSAPAIEMTRSEVRTQSTYNSPRVECCR